MKETFIIRTEWYAAISELSTEEQAIIFKNLFEYHLGHPENIQTPTITVKLVWNLIEPNVKRNIEKYDRRCETSAENGKLGGRPKKEEEKPNQEPKKPNEKPNNPDSDSVSDNESESESEDEKKEDLFEQFWNGYNYKIGRKAALKAWNRLSKKDKAAAITYIPTYYATKPKWQQAKHPSTYLNGETWLDEQPKTPVISMGKIDKAQAVDDEGMITYESNIRLRVWSWDDFMDVKAGKKPLSIFDRKVS